MPAKSIAKTKRAEAERAAEWFLREEFGCVVTRRAVRTQWQKVDFFGSDVVGKREDGTHVYAQATAGKSQAVTARRRKLEAIPWLFDSDIVLLLQLLEDLDPANRRRKIWHFRVHQYDYWIGTNIDREWNTWDEAFRVPKEWFKAWKETDNERARN